MGGAERLNLAAVDAASGAVLDWRANTNDPVVALGVSESAVFAGGGFDSVGGVLRENLAALDAETGAATSWNPGLRGEVRTMVVSGSTLYVSGSSTRSQGRNGITSRPSTRRPGP